MKNVFALSREEQLDQLNRWVSLIGKDNHGHDVSLTHFKSYAELKKRITDDGYGIESVADWAAADNSVGIDPDVYALLNSDNPLVIADYIETHGVTIAEAMEVAEGRCLGLVKNFQDVVLRQLMKLNDEQVAIFHSVFKMQYEEAIDLNEIGVTKGKRYIFKQ